MEELLPPGSLRKDPHLIARCARCEEWEVTDEVYREDAIRQIRFSGWRQKRGEGWVCPDCLGAEEPQPDPKQTQYNA